MTHVIFLLHGVGKYGVVEKDTYKPDDAGWFKEAESALRTVYDAHIKSLIGEGRAFDAQFTIVPINYNGIFDRYRDAWARQAKDWSKIQGGFGELGLPGEWLDLTSKFLSKANDDNFAWTHLADVLLYVVPTIREAIVSGVITTMFEKLRAAPDSWSVIGYSLGSAVMQDTYAGLITRFGEEKVAFRPPTVMCAIANVARALGGKDSDVYTDDLAPGSKGFRPARYLNFNHKYDFIARIDPFRPNVPSWNEAWAKGFYYELSDLDEYYLDPSLLDWKGVSLTDAVKKLLPHGFGHYIAQPDLAGYLWPALLGRQPGDWFTKISGSMHQANKVKQDEAYRKALKAEVEHALAAFSAPEAQKEIKTVLPAIMDFFGAKP